MSTPVRFRAERVKDVILFVHQLSHTERASMEVQPFGAYEDDERVEIGLTLDRNTIADLRRYMCAIGISGYEMASTLAPAAGYTGQHVWEEAEREAALLAQFGEGAVFLVPEPLVKVTRTIHLVPAKEVEGLPVEAVGLGANVVIAPMDWTTRKSITEGLPQGNGFTEVYHTTHTEDMPTEGVTFKLEGRIGPINYTGE